MEPPAKIERIFERKVQKGNFFFNFSRLERCSVFFNITKKIILRLFEEQRQTQVGFAVFFSLYKLMSAGILSRAN